MKQCPNCKGMKNLCFTCNDTGMVLEDYEPCSECGYDHGYETAFATTAHTNIMFVMAFDMMAKRSDGGGGNW